MYAEDEHPMDISMSACQELDVVGMQPHSREFLEYAVNMDRSIEKAKRIMRVQVETTDGIQYDERP